MDRGQKCTMGGVRTRAELRPIVSAVAELEVAPPWDHSPALPIRSPLWGGEVREVRTSFPAVGGTAL